MIINKGTEIIEIIIIEVETKIEIINNNMGRGDSIKETTKVEIISNFKIINNNLTKIKITKKSKPSVFCIYIFY
jgi:hypothetical protein